MIGTVEADLIIVIRRGHGRLADATISDPRQNNRAGVINPTDNGIGVGAQRGTQPGLVRRPTGRGIRKAGIRRASLLPDSQPQLEVGGADDSFMVFDGKVQKPLDGAPGWRYVAPDGLNRIVFLRWRSSGRRWLRRRRRRRRSLRVAMQGKGESRSPSGRTTRRARQRQCKSSAQQRQNAALAVSQARSSA